MFDNFDDVLTADAVCSMLFIGKNTLYSLLNSGELKGFRIGKGRNWRIPRSSIEEYILNKCTESIGKNNSPTR